MDIRNVGAVFGSEVAYSNDDKEIFLNSNASITVFGIPNNFLNNGDCLRRGAGTLWYPRVYNILGYTSI